MRLWQKVRLGFQKQKISLAPCNLICHTVNQENFCCWSTLVHSCLNYKNQHHRTFPLWTINNTFLQEVWSYHKCLIQKIFLWSFTTQPFPWFMVQHKIIICDRLCINPTIHRKTLKSSLLHHPLTELLLTMTMFSIFLYDLLFSSYTTLYETVYEVILRYMKCTFQLYPIEIYISRNVRFQFRNRTPVTNSPRTNCFVFDEWSVYA